MANKITDVSSKSIEFDRSNFLDEAEFDRTWVRVSAFYLPSRNRQTFELVLPRLRNQMRNEFYDRLKNIKNLINWHDIPYKKVSNSEFHKFLRNNTTKKIKLFNEDSRIYKTNYYSTKLPLRAMQYDYEGLLLVYLNYPERQYLRRSPCTSLAGSPDMIEMMNKFLDLECQDFIDNDVKLNDYFFIKPGKINGIRIAYTKEKKFEYTYSEEPYKPEYYIIDLSHEYFKSGIVSLSSWCSSVVKERCESDEIFYRTEQCSQEPNAKKDDYSGIGDFLGSFHSWHRDLKLYKLNKEQMSKISNNYKAMSEYDMKQMSGRHSWNKFEYNEFVMHKADFYCPIILKNGQIMTADGKIVPYQNGVSETDPEAVTLFTPIEDKDGSFLAETYTE